MSVPVFRPTIRRKDMDAVLTCMVSDNIGPGALSQQLSADIAAYLGIEPGFCVRDYAGAIDAALDAVGSMPGDRVAISSLAPSIYRHVFEKRGIRPLLLDVDPSSGTVSAESVQAMGISELKALIVHYTGGIIPDIQSIVDLGIPVVEDISEGFGGITSERRIGTYGQYTILGLEPEHIITCGGGAAVLAGGKRERSELRRVAETLPREMLLSDMNAALGLQQVKRIEQFIQKRREIASIYHRALLRGRHKLLLQPGEAENVFHSFAVVLASGAREVIQYARKKQVECIYAFEGSLYGSLVRPTAHQETPESAESDHNGEPPDTVAHEMKLDAAAFPGARSLTLRCILFPLYPVLPKREVDRIEKVVTSLP